MKIPGRHRFTARDLFTSCSGLHQSHTTRSESSSAAQVVNLKGDSQICVFPSSHDFPARVSDRHRQRSLRLPGLLTQTAARETNDD